MHAIWEYDPMSLVKFGFLDCKHISNGDHFSSRSSEFQDINDSKPQHIWVIDAMCRHYSWVTCSNWYQHWVFFPLFFIFLVEVRINYWGFMMYWNQEGNLMIDFKDIHWAVLLPPVKACTIILTKISIWELV